jgi:hypothetical protein
LSAQLNDAITRFDPSKPLQKQLACAGLTAYGVAVRAAQAARLIPAATASDLLADATRIQAVMGC